MINKIEYPLTWDMASCSAEGIRFSASWAASLSCKILVKSCNVTEQEKLQNRHQSIYEIKPAGLLHESKEVVSQQIISSQKVPEA
jgi:hypothetical protein